jgi:hypothetical protein
MNPALLRRYVAVFTLTLLCLALVVAEDVYPKYRSALFIPSLVTYVLFCGALLELLWLLAEHPPLVTAQR